MMLTRFLSSLALLSFFILSPATAVAGDGIFAVSEAKAKSYFDAGLAVVSREPYVGSDKNERLVLPFVNTEYKGRLYLKPAVGAGVYLINKDRLRLGAGVNVALGRSGKDVPVLGKVGKLGSSLTGNINARYLLPFAALDLSGSIPLTGDIEGSRLDIVLTTQISLAKNLRITPGVRATYQSRGWINSFYGISAMQAAAASSTPFGYSGQFSTLGLHAAAFYKLSDTLEIVSAVNYSVLTGDVKASPLTPDNRAVTLALGIARKF